MWFSFHRHQVLRILPKDEVQVSLLKKLEPLMEFEVL